MAYDPPAIGIIVTLKVDPADGARFEQIMTDLCAEVRAEEPGTLLYGLCRLPDQPGTYRMIEAYADDAAREAHRRGAALRKFGPLFVPLLTEKAGFDPLFDLLT